MATISIKEVNGAGAGTPTTVTNITLATTDAYSPSGFSLVKPSTGNTYSYWKVLYLNADTAPAGTINNIKVFSDGTVGWTGTTLKLGVSDAYVQATGTAGLTGLDAEVSYDEGITMTSAGDYTSASPLSLTGTLSNPDTGKVSQYLVMQATLSTSSTTGDLDSETITFRWDET